MKPAPRRLENIQSMRKRYGISYERFKDFYNRHKDQIGEYLGRGFTPRQVHIMDELWGYSHP